MHIALFVGIIVCTQNLRIVWVGKALKAHLLPSPLLGTHIFVLDALGWTDLFFFSSDTQLIY